MPPSGLSPSSPTPPGAPEEDYSLATPEEIAVRQKRRRLLLWGSVAVIAVVCLGFAARPTVRTVKAWQARRTAAEALKLLEADKIDEAVRKLQDALSLRGTDPEVMHAAAVFLTRVGHGKEGLTFWKEIEKTRALTRDEQRDCASDFLQAGDPVEARRRMRLAWPEGTDGTAADWYLGMQLAIRERNAAAAVPLARRLVDGKTGGISELQRLEAAAALLGVNDPAAHADGDTALRSISAGGRSRESLEADLILTKQASQQIAVLRDKQQPVPESISHDLLDFTSKIENHPQAGALQKLVALQTKMLAQPEERPVIIQRAVEQYGQSKDNNELTALGTWLYSQGEFKRVLDLITPERSVSSRPLYLLYLDTLGAQGRWEDIRRAIEGQRFTLEPMIEQMYLARCATQLHQPDSSTVHWNAALQAAGASPEKLLNLGRYAQNDGATTTAEAAYRAAIKAAPENRLANEALLALLESLGRTRDARETIRKMLAVWPQDTAVRNDDAYLGALLGEDLQANRQTARELVRTEPGSLPHRVTLALVELRLGHDLTALETLQTVATGAFASQPRFLAVYAAVLWQTHSPADARNAAKNAARDHLLPEERALLDRVKTTNEPD